MSSGSENGMRRWLAWGLVTIGYAYGHLYRAIRLRKRYRRVRIGPLSFVVPTTWGDFEPTREGDFVIRNRPTKDMISGDILWYSEIAEVRVRPPGAPPLPALAPMEEVRTTVRSPQGDMVVALRVARGVGVRRRAEGERVVSSLRVARTHRPLVWPTTHFSGSAGPEECRPGNTSAVSGGGTGG